MTRIIVFGGPLTVASRQPNVRNYQLTTINDQNPCSAISTALTKARDLLMVS
jgi:hypothetical protein